MSNSLIEGKPQPLSLRPVGGKIYAHVFENTRTGVPRNLFWGLYVAFEAVRIDGDDWDCSSQYA
jgi:hypothetical protein